MEKQNIETKWIYAVSFLMKDSKDNLQLNLINGFADTEFFVNHFTDYSNEINKMNFKDSILAINSNFIKYVNNKEEESFEINLNTNDIKTTKMTDFINELFARFIKKQNMQ